MWKVFYFFLPIRNNRPGKRSVWNHMETTQIILSHLFTHVFHWRRNISNMNLISRDCHFYFMTEEFNLFSYFYFVSVHWVQMSSHFSDLHWLYFIHRIVRQKWIFIETKRKCLEIHKNINHFRLNQMVRKQERCWFGFLWRN